ncbi:hypothetical protein DEJ49_25105 [Streptomyces venezuelae]|uniref:Uncharacterized protein n=1 Tax=Streptomyces venezuelae TaxID=54571 RepID=A0A5P2CN63_STRVZ|nr:DUF6284 family protein [Streptomyces venezuelae]QES43833.1 hypothetical protein DEJ49_25105 [Streptomyces venezuelae]
MMHIAALQAAVTADGIEGEPTAAELDAIEHELPAILADVELLDAQIITLDRVPNEVDARRLRRAHRKVLAARRALTNTPHGMAGGAA